MEPPGALKHDAARDQHPEMVWGSLLMLARLSASASSTSGLDTRQSTAPSTSNWFLKGVLGNVLNPKMGVFMLFAARLALSHR
ncbi:hypothetical protein UA70_08410 [Raoultella planticola]|nr:hypothetical protein UA70_08410 [Raoultella planticola]